MFKSQWRAGKKISLWLDKSVSPFKEQYWKQITFNKTRIMTPDYILPSYCWSQYRIHMYLDAQIQCSFLWIDKTLIIVIELCQSLIRKTTSLLILSPLGYSFIHYSFQATPLGCIPFIPNSLHYYISLKFKRQPPLSSPSNQVSLKFTPSLLPIWELITNHWALY